MNTRRKQKFKIHTGSVSEKDKVGKKVLQSMPYGYSKLVYEGAEYMQKIRISTTFLKPSLNHYMSPLKISDSNMWSMARVAGRV